MTITVVNDTATYTGKSGEQLTAAGIVAPAGIGLKDSATGALQRMFIDPAGEAIQEVTSLRSYFSDDFGGNAVDATKWDVYDGGLGAVTVQPGNVAQTAIGTGTTGITHSVTTSSLAVVMGTTNAAEKWFLSKAMFCCTENIMIIAMKSQAIAANMIQIGLVEVDPVTGYPYQNGTVTTEFTNKATVEFGQTTTNTFAGLRTISDNSPAEFAPAASVFAPAAMTTLFETQLQIRAEDVHAHSAVVDSAAAKTATPLRVSQQVPNDTKVYKLLMRFKNVSAPGSSTTFTIYRILVENHQSMLVSIAEGPGSQAGSQGLVANISTALPSGGNLIGAVFAGISSGANSGAAATTAYQLVSAATTNGNVVVASPHRLASGQLTNYATSAKHVKLYNKSTAPTVGTDVPLIIITVPAGSATAPGVVNIVDVIGAFGLYFNAGIGIAITGVWLFSDTTAVAAGDVNVQLNYL